MDGQSLTGDLVADSISSITASMQNNSSLIGAINSGNTARSIDLTLDASSTWTVTGNSYLSCLSNSSGISGSTISNVIGNGYTVFYDKDACLELAGQTYTLKGGGSLEPVQ